MAVKQNIYRNLLNIPGFKSSRKIVVIESDDWGSIRMPSIDVFNELIAKNIRVDKLEYNKFDSLASESDLHKLFEVLHSIKDKNGNSAILTANTIVANPDFEKIRESNFTRYYYEPFTETLKRYPEHSGAFALWKKGINEHVFQPQFHGREHLNVNRWMYDLRQNRINTKIAFDLKMYDLSVSKQVNEDTYVESLFFANEDEIEFQKESIVSGLNLFEKIFGFRSKTFIAPCYIWSNKLNKTLFDNGIEAFQGNWIQLEPAPHKNQRFIKHFHYLGQRNSLGQIYLTRNIPFEPCKEIDYNWVDEALKRIEIAFKWKKPAIICSHRVNYIGYLVPSNRDRNLILLRKLLIEIVRKWPDVEFMSSDMLVNFMKYQK